MSEKRDKSKDVHDDAVHINDAQMAATKRVVADASIDAISLASHRRAIAYGRARGNA